MQIATQQLKRFCKKFRLPFRNLRFLHLALTHSSFRSHASSLLIQKHSDLGEDNERLEFLGDSVLDLLISEYLFGEFRDKPEGYLSKLRSYVVSRTCLFKISQELELQTLVLSMYNIARSPDKYKTVLANSVEAIIGALYLDRGYKVTYRSMLRFFLVYIEEVISGLHKRDYKSIVQNYVQQNFGARPTYQALSMTDKSRRVFVRISFPMGGRKKYLSRKIGGASKKIAEQLAAEDVCKDLKIALDGELLF